MCLSCAVTEISGHENFWVTTLTSWGDIIGHVITGLVVGTLLLAPMSPACTYSVTCQALFTRLHNKNSMQHEANSFRTRFSRTCLYEFLLLQALSTHSYNKNTWQNKANCFKTHFISMFHRRCPNKDHYKNVNIKCGEKSKICLVNTAKPNT